MSKLKLLKPPKSFRNNGKGKITEIKSFLDNKYIIKSNQFDLSKSIIQVKSDEEIIDFDQLFLDVYEEGIGVGKDILKTVLKSNKIVKTYNPILEYFEKIKNSYSGKSHIDLLCSYLKPVCFDGKPEKFYQDRMYYIIKKWLVASVACIYGYHPNDVALGFIHPKEGFGKTHLTKFFCPDALDDLMIESDKRSEVFCLTTELSRNFLIIYDELVGLNFRSADEFKKNLSAKIMNLKIQGFIKKMPRMANIVFSSNKSESKGGFLHHSFGTRRFGTIEIEEINHDYSANVDINQVWAEALNLFEGDYLNVQNTKAPFWNFDDFQEFKNYNMRYIIETPAMKIIKLWCKKGDNNNLNWLMPSEILEILINNKKLTAEQIRDTNPEKIGEALSNLGYDKKRIRRKDLNNQPRQCYNVIL